MIDRSLLCFSQLQITFRNRKLHFEITNYISKLQITFRNYKLHFEITNYISKLQITFRNCKLHFEITNYISILQITFRYCKLQFEFTNYISILQITYRQKLHIEIANYNYVDQWQESLVNFQQKYWQFRLLFWPKNGSNDAKNECALQA
jgi:hypothetical protein